MNITKESISELLGEKTIGEIADIHGCNPSTIKRHMRYHGLKQDTDFIKRKRSESAYLGGKAHKGTERPNQKVTHKVCGKCGEDKDIEEFYTRGENAYNRYCKPCFNKYTSDRWIEIKKKAIKYKGGECEDCYKEYHYAVFEFHHLDPEEKDVDWSKLKLRSWDKITKELDKCALLCANCHRMRHIEE